MTTRTLRALEKRANELLVMYGSAENEARTPLTRELAVILVECREHFLTADGEPDWTGKTYPYRQYVREIFDGANVGREEQARIQAAIRYHVSSVLRERLDAEQLEAIGLISETARERSLTRRQSRAALVNAITAKDANGGALMALTAIAAILGRIDFDDVAALKGEDRNFALAKLQEVERASRRGVRILKG